jgi:putative ABC transport system permease protein
MVSTRILRTFLYGTSAVDPVTFVVTAALLTVVAVAASFLPARRATRVDPMVALRHE